MKGPQISSANTLELSLRLSYSFTTACLYLPSFINSTFSCLLFVFRTPVHGYIFSSVSVSTLLDVHTATPYRVSLQESIPQTQHRPSSFKIDIFIIHSTILAMVYYSNTISIHISNMVHSFQSQVKYFFLLFKFSYVKGIVLFCQLL